MMSVRDVVLFFTHITEWIMWSGVAVGLVSALLGAVAVSLAQPAFAAFAAWSVGLLAASTGIAVGAWLPLGLVAVAGAAAYALGTALQDRLLPSADAVEVAVPQSVPRP